MRAQEFIQSRTIVKEQVTQLSPNMSVSPNQDPNSPEEWDYHYKGQQIKPGDPFHSQIKDLHLRQTDPTYDAFRNAFDNPLKPGPAVPEQPPQGDTIIPSRPAPREKIKGPDGIPVKLKDFFPQDPAILESEGQYTEEYLYHATYRPLLKSIRAHGLGGDKAQAKWEDSKPGVVYLATDPNVAESYAESSDVVPDEWLDQIVIIKIAANKLDQSRLFIDQNVQDNAGDTLEYHGVIPVDSMSLLENFADGKNPQDKGDSKRHGINTKASVSSLRKTAKQGGRKGQLAHWLANMKAGRAKAKNKTNETVIGNLHFPQLTIAVDDHAIDRTRTRGINPATIDLSLRKLNAVADQLSQIEPNAQVWAYDAENNLGLGLRRISSRDMLFKLKTVVAARPFDGAIPIIELS